MRGDGRGHPRLERSRRPGRSVREEILDAAAELFTTHGYARSICCPNCGRRGELRDRYAALARRVIAESAGPDDAYHLPFRLVESVINRRSDGDSRLADQPWIIADAALRTLGFTGDFAALRTLTGQRLRLADKVQV